jgi:hypothetical protein
VKVVTERLGHAYPSRTMATHQRVLPAMQAEATASAEGHWATHAVADRDPAFSKDKSLWLTLH